MRRIDNGIRELDGQKLTSMRVNPHTGATRFTFDLGCQPECRRYEVDQTSDLWVLYEPREMVTVVR